MIVIVGLPLLFIFYSIRALIAMALILGYALWLSLIGLFAVVLFICRAVVAGVHGLRGSPSA